VPLCRWERFDGPVLVRLAFYLDRPKSHFGAKGLRPTAPDFPHKRPDLDHLQRAIFDALTQAGVWMDDSQVVTAHAAKRYCSPTSALSSPGVIVEVAALPLETYEEDTAA
jgi:Holliday junction resolvase RusA-like endonuclease